jgi:hypothetical protein
MIIKDAFYSKNNQGQLIQNNVFEYMDDNLEYLIQRHIKNKQNILETTIKLLACNSARYVSVF